MFIYNLLYRQQYLLNLFFPFDDMSVGELNEYTIQLNVYKYFIEKYTDSVNYYVNLHSFRAFFRTNAGKINQDFAESLLGHGGYLTQYVRLSPEELGSNYRKLEPKLRIWE